MTNPIITLAPNRVSTWKPDTKGDNQWFDSYDNFTVGEIWADPVGIVVYNYTDGIAPLDIKDLACPTWGLGRSTAANGTVITTIGPPWLPLILPPMEMFTLNPIWAASCTGIFSDQFGLSTLALFDPPTALTPVTGLLPTPRPTLTPASTPAGSTTFAEGATPSTEAAKPVSFPNDPAAPAKTGDPGRDGPTQSHTIASPKSTSLLDNSATSPNEKGDPPSDPKVPSVHAVPGNAPADSNAPSSGIPDPPLDGSQNSIIDPKVSTVPGSPQGEKPPTQTQGLGAIIYNAFGKSGPEIGGSSTILLSPQPVFTIGAQTFTANPSAFSIAGTTLSADGPAVTISGTAISLGQNGALEIGSSTISLPTPSDLSPTQVYTAAGQTFTPNLSAFSIDGTIISAGGRAATVHGTIISLGRNGALQIGSSTISLPTPSDPSPSKVYTVAGQTFIPNPSAFPIDGTIVSAGGPAATIHGTIISLGQNGALQIGSSTISLPTGPPGKVYTVAGQTFTPNPSTFPIDGTLVSAGGPAATVQGTIVSLGPNGALQIGSSTIPLLPSQASSNTTIDGFDIDAQSSLVVVDGVTLSPAAPGVTISGERVSLEAGGKTVDIGTGRFAVPTATTTGDGVGVQAFAGGQGRGLEASLSLVCGIVVGVGVVAVL